ncbi:hypothetical protein DFR67_119112 [Williamsia limnetica]|uniref:Uncharacterized protein n=1 Tax=Williamsia limnetica TaxID=882452 RepID=A0A318RCD2_WILLI|nr:hypothetical protein DFR67_119112 [Williamsia limnetica]
MVNSRLLGPDHEGDIRPTAEADAIPGVARVFNVEHIVFKMVGSGDAHLGVCSPEPTNFGGRGQTFLVTANSSPARMPPITGPTTGTHA